MVSHRFSQKEPSRDSPHIGSPREPPKLPVPPQELLQGLGPPPLAHRLGQDVASVVDVWLEELVDVK